MYDENQIVTTKWNNKYKKWYEAHGYTPCKANEPFDVAAKDLPVHSSVKITVICDYCGAEYKTQYAVITSGRKVFPKDACSRCAGKKVQDINRDKRAKKHIDMAKEYCKLHGYTLLTTEEEYAGARKSLRFVCPKHGEQSMLVTNFLRGHKCAQCAAEETGKSNRLSKKYVKDIIESVNGNILLNPDDYIGANIHNLKIQCQCGNTFTTSYNFYTCYNVVRCRNCSKKESSGEFQIRTFLEKNNIPFIQEQRFSDCRNLRPLPFDFYLPDYNTIIEFDGRQHFDPVFGDENYNQTKWNDNIKNKYCEENNIKLLRIPYWEGSKIEEIISKELNIAI